MTSVIDFAEFIENRLLSGPRALVAQPNAQQPGFTLRDREDLDDWSNAERRVSVCASDMGAFAMLYRLGRPWASWGVVRQGRCILLWDCISLADIGRYASMMDALAALPTDDFRAPVENIILFAKGQARASSNELTPTHQRCRPA